MSAGTSMGYGKRDGADAVNIQCVQGFEGPACSPLHRLVLAGGSLLTVRGSSDLTGEDTGRYLRLYLPGPTGLAPGKVFAAWSPEGSLVGLAIGARIDGAEMDRRFFDAAEHPDLSGSLFAALRARGNSKFGYVDRIVVREDARGRGIGRSLLRRLVAYFTKHTVPLVVCARPAGRVGTDWPTRLNFVPLPAEGSDGWEFLVSPISNPAFAGTSIERD